MNPIQPPNPSDNHPNNADHGNTSGNLTQQITSAANQPTDQADKLPPTTVPAKSPTKPLPPSTGPTLWRGFNTLLLLACTAAIMFGVYSYWQSLQKPKVDVLTREGVISKVQTLNRLQTVVYNVDTVITSQKQGNWYALWQDQQKALFVAHGRVQAGIDLNQLTTNQVTVSADGKNVQITLPAAQVFDTYLDNIEVYDIQTGVFGMVDVDLALFAEAQTAGKAQVLASACKSQILKLATDNAQKQVQGLFALANLSVTVTPTPATKCG